MHIHIIFWSSLALRSTYSKTKGIRIREQMASTGRIEKKKIGQMMGNMECETINNWGEPHTSELALHFCLFFIVVCTSYRMYLEDSIDQLVQLLIINPIYM